MNTATLDFTFDSLPPPFFPEDAIAVPDLPLARAAGQLPLVTVSPADTTTRKALRIVRAKTGESEMRLLMQETQGAGVTYIVRTAMLSPYKHEDKELLKNGKPMNEAQARASFDRLVAGSYPAVQLRKNVSVATYENLL